MTGMMPDASLSPGVVATCTTLASLLEASAPKPGNVWPGRPFRDMGYEDFVASAVAAGPELGLAGTRGVGATILAAVRATRQWTTANTNLGIILLLAPLAAAALRAGGSLRQRTAAVLEGTTVADARETYAAIRETRAGGLGTTDAQDVAAEPTVTLLEAMRLAAGRDLVAREYVTGFAVTFDSALPALRLARGSGLALQDAIVETYLTLLSREPDTLIARKLGLAAAEAVRDDAGKVVRKGGVRTRTGRAAVAAFDSALRDAQNSRNPGSTADLTAAALFAGLIEDGWESLASRKPRAQ
jgi:triphosphoribosyl-dephospho-CoA synthase